MEKDRDAVKDEVQALVQGVDRGRDAAGKIRIGGKDAGCIVVKVEGSAVVGARVAGRGWNGSAAMPQRFEYLTGFYSSPQLLCGLESFCRWRFSVDDSVVLTAGSTIDLLPAMTYICRLRQLLTAE